MIDGVCTSQVAVEKLLGEVIVTSRVLNDYMVLIWRQHIPFVGKPTVAPSIDVNAVAIPFLQLTDKPQAVDMSSGKSLIAGDNRYELCLIRFSLGYIIIRLSKPDRTVGIEVYSDIPREYSRSVNDILPLYFRLT